jgi:predicted small metal-binding protein
MCDGVVTGDTKAEVIEGIKKHGAEAHGLDPMPQAEIDKRKPMIKEY